MIVAVYAAAVATLVIIGRRGDAAAVARIVPDCIVLARRLAADPRLTRGARTALVALVFYLVLPIDIIPDFIPVAGYLDDAILVIVVLRRVIRSAGQPVIVAHWPGPGRGLQILLRAIG
jgi:uncharacterized membrane protein YkvA (DUF1232 family)